MSRVTARPAKPDRYLVDRQGTPDPASSVYYVLDVVNDWQAREALAYLGNKYRQQNQTTKAQECFDLLAQTNEKHMEIMRARDAERNKTSKKGNGRR